MYFFIMVSFAESLIPQIQIGEKMNGIMIKVGGVLNALLGIFHLFFWSLFNWPENLACLSFDDQAIMQVLNIHVALPVFIFAYLSIFQSKDMLGSRVGKTMIIGIALFYIVRAINEVVFWGLQNTTSIGSLAIWLIIACLYVVPLVMAKDQKA